jgi:hypothetical protein
LNPDPGGDSSRGILELLYLRGYCLWQYGPGGWFVKKRACMPGYTCGGPPQEKGAFMGDIRRKYCQPDPAQQQQQQSPKPRTP